MNGEVDVSSVNSGTDRSCTCFDMFHGMVDGLGKADLWINCMQCVSDSKNEKHFLAMNGEKDASLINSGTNHDQL